MKKLLALTLLLPLFSANAFENKANVQVKLKNKTEQTKIFSHHEQNWHQREHGHQVVLFNCFDSWGNNLRGRFTNDEQYFIELGGGSCSKIHNHHREKINLSQISHYNFPLDSVYQVIEQIKREYQVNHVRLIQAENVDAGYKTFKYTLVFDTNNRKQREFRVKQNRHTAELRAIYEV